MYIFRFGVTAWRLSVPEGRRPFHRSWIYCLFSLTHADRWSGRYQLASVHWPCAVKKYSLEDQFAEIRQYLFWLRNRNYFNFVFTFYSNVAFPRVPPPYDQNLIFPVYRMQLIRLLHRRPQPFSKRRRTLSDCYYGKNGICIQEIKLNTENLAFTCTLLCYVVSLLGVFVYGNWTTESSPNNEILRIN